MGLRRRSEGWGQALGLGGGVRARPGLRGEAGAISAAISISQDLVRDEQPVDGAALGDAAEDERDGRGRERAAQAEEARAGGGGVEAAHLVRVRARVRVRVRVRVT